MGLFFFSGGEFPTAALWGSWREGREVNAGASALRLRCHGSPVEAPAPLPVTPGANLSPWREPLAKPPEPVTEADIRGQAAEAVADAEAETTAATAAAAETAPVIATEKATAAPIGRSPRWRGAGQRGRVTPGRRACQIALIRFPYWARASATCGRPPAS